MSWDRPDVDRAHRSRVLARIVFALGVALMVSGVAMSANEDRVHGLLVQRFGSSERDRAVQADPESMEGTLMSKDALEEDPRRSIISYEYIYEGEMFVGYAVVDADATVAWKRLGPIDIEVARSQPELSRPRGMVLAPRGWISDQWAIWASRFALGQAFASAALIGLSVWVRSRI